MITPNVIQQSNDRVRRAIAAVRILRDAATMNQLYCALSARRRARDLRAKPQSKHWIKLGL